MKFCLQRFGLDILLPALSTFRDTNNIFANSANFLANNMYLRYIQSMLNEKSLLFVMFGLDILLPALSTFMDTDDMFANIFDEVEDNTIDFPLNQGRKVLFVMFGLNYLSC